MLNNETMVCPNSKICNLQCSHKELHRFMESCTRICERLKTDAKVKCVCYHEFDIFNTFNDIFDDFLKERR